MAPTDGLQLGLFLTPEAAQLDALRAQVALADRGGLDQLHVQDHPYQRRQLDTMSLIPDLLARTERLRVVTAVANLPLRHPAMLAKAAATLSVLSGGRFELGLGSGAFWDAVVAMGGVRRTPREAVDALEEAIPLIRRAWAGEPSIRSDGPIYPVHGYRPGPVPERPPGIWLGAYRPRMLRLTGGLADGWIPTSPYAPPEVLPEMQQRIDDAAATAGRDPEAVHRVYVINARITDGAVDGLSGPVEHWVDQIARFHRDLRFDALILWPDGDDVDAQVRRFVEEVAPAARAAVA